MAVAADNGRRHRFATLLHGVGAARGKAAARRQRREVRRCAGDRHQPAARLDPVQVRVKQALRIGVRCIAMIFQEPATALDPVFTIGQQITETLVRHQGMPRGEAHRRALEWLERVQIPSARRRLDSYPHEMSGGMRQRAMIALALSCNPTVLLADEPTTALDVTVQIQILLLLRELQRELGMAVIFVTHDVGAAVEVSDRLAVMYAGRFVETGAARDVLRKRAPQTTRAPAQSP
jgi:ABC-type dipeptide/oligopeptide/nickel transport system ATPase component